MTTSIAGCNRRVGWIDLGGMGRGNPNPGKEENSNQTNKRVLSSKQMLKSGGIALIVYDSHIVSKYWMQGAQNKVKLAIFVLGILQKDLKPQ